MRYLLVALSIITCACGDASQRFGYALQDMGHAVSAPNEPRACHTNDDCPTWHECAKGPTSHRGVCVRM